MLNTSRDDYTQQNTILTQENVTVETTTDQNYTARTTKNNTSKQIKTGKGAIGNSFENPFFNQKFTNQISNWPINNEFNINKHSNSKRTNKSNRISALPTQQQSIESELQKKPLVSPVSSAASNRFNKLSTSEAPTIRRRPSPGSKKRYQSPQSSDIFALKQFTQNKTKNDLCEMIAFQSGQNNMLRRKERLLVESGDFERFVKNDQRAKMLRSHQNQSQFSKTQYGLNFSRNDYQVKNATTAAATQSRFNNENSNAGSAKKLLNGSSSNRDFDQSVGSDQGSVNNSKKKFTTTRGKFITRNCAAVINQTSITTVASTSANGVTQGAGSDMCKTLIGEMPVKSSREQRIEKLKSFASKVEQNKVVSSSDLEQLEKMIILNGNNAGSRLQHSEQSFDSSSSPSHRRGGVKQIKANVTSEIYTQREMEVLRAKISKRIIMQQKTDQASEKKRQLFCPEYQAPKIGPQRLNMEKTSRKTVMKILQDSKQKLRKTRQEMIREIKSQRERQHHHSSSSLTQMQNNSQLILNKNSRANLRNSYSILTTPRPQQFSKGLFSPISDLSTTKDRQSPHVTANQARASSQVSKQTTDQVLNSSKYGNMTLGLPAIAGQDDMLRSMSEIKDDKTRGLYHTKLAQKQQKKERAESRLSVNDTPSVYLPNFMQTGNFDLPDYITRKILTQEDKEKEQRNRKWLVSVDQTEQYALCRDEDLSRLHGLLQYKVPAYIKVKPEEGNNLYDLYTEEPKQIKLTEAESDAEKQKLYHDNASKFWKKKEVNKDTDSKAFEQDADLIKRRGNRQVQAKRKEGSRLMTRKSMQDLLTQLTQEQKCHIAANLPQYGEISYNKVVNQIFDQKVKDDFDAEVNSILKSPNHEPEKFKGLALLLRRELDKTSTQLEDEQAMQKIQDYVEKLGSFQKYRDGTSHFTEQLFSRQASYKGGSTIIETLNFLKKMTLQQPEAQTLKKNPKDSSLVQSRRQGLTRMGTVDPGALRKQNSIFTEKTLLRKLSLVSKSTAAVEAPSVRKSNRKGLKNLAMKKLKTQEKLRYPLQNLTEDQTDEFSLNTIAIELGELIQSYRVYKNSLNNYYLEYEQEDHRLGYFLQCLQSMEMILPVLKQVSSEGTLYLKEYFLGTGQCLGLNVACSLHPYLIKKVLIDNCGIAPLDLVELVAGFAHSTIRSLVIRRSAISDELPSFLAKIAMQIFPFNLNTLKIEKCQISKNATLEIAKFLRDKSYIRVLSLVRVNFDQESVKVFCEYLTKKPYVEDLDLSDNRLEPKIFMPILEALIHHRSLKSLNISWNTLLENSKGAQIGTYVQQEKLIFGMAQQATMQAAIQADAQEKLRSPQAASSSDLGSSRLVSQTPDFLNLDDKASLASPKYQDRMNTTQQVSFSQMTSQKQSDDLSKVRVMSPQEGFIHNTNNKVGKVLSAGETTVSNLNDLSEEELKVSNLIKIILKSHVMQHIDLSDTGLTDNILLSLSKTINVSPSLLFVHLSGNPGLKENVMSRIQGKLRATFEAPLLHQTFQPLIRMYNNKHGIRDDKIKAGAKINNSILDEISERDSLSSDSQYKYQPTQQKMMKSPEQLQNQLAFKSFMKEREGYLPIDDAKLSRDNQRHFMVSRVLGHDLDNPGASEWQINRQSAQQCWLCERKQFTFFFWSPEFGDFDPKKCNWLSSSDRNKIVETVFVDRETNNKREQNRCTIHRSLLTPVHKRKIYDEEINNIRELQSDEESEDISFDDSSSGQSEGSDLSNDSYKRGLTKKVKINKDIRQPRRKIIYNGPVIMGKFNNWQPQPLIKVQRLAATLDQRKKPDFIKQCQELKRCRPEVTHIDQMNKKERLFYESRIDQEEESYSQPDVWGPVIAKYLQSRYRQARVVGSENFESLQPKQIYVCSAFLDMGKNNYIVSYNSRTYFHETTVSFRRDPIPTAVKGRKDAVVKERKANVFKDWQQDTAELIEKMYETDYESSRLDGIVRNEMDKQDLKDVILYHFSFIKDLFLTLSINSGEYPFVPLNYFQKFCRKCKLEDKRFDGAQIRLILAAVKTQANILDRLQPGKGPQDLDRSEFTEALVRIANKKFKEYSKMTTLRDAVDKLIIEKLKPNQDIAPWQSFRDEELWTREVNLVYHDNQEGLKKLYQKYAKPGINKIPYLNALQLLTTDCSIKLDKFDAMYCYSMSLSSCVDLFKATFNKLMHQTYEEFLEMIARAAEFHFQDSDQEGLALWEKILRVLDEFFKLVEDCGVPVMPRWTEEEEENESEPETPIHALQRSSMIKSDLYSSVVTGAQQYIVEQGNYIR